MRMGDSNIFSSEENNCPINASQSAASRPAFFFGMRALFREAPLRQKVA